MIERQSLPALALAITYLGNAKSCSKLSRTSSLNFKREPLFAVTPLASKCSSMVYVDVIQPSVFDRGDQLKNLNLYSAVQLNLKVASKIRSPRRLEAQSRRFVAVVFFVNFIDIAWRDIARTQLLRSEMAPHIDINTMTIGNTKSTLGGAHHRADALLHRINKVDACDERRIRSGHSANDA